MTLDLHAVATTPGRIRLWVGSDGPVVPEDVEWRLDGRARDPEVVRRLQPVAPWAPEATSWSGLYELGPDGVTGQRQRLEVRDPRDRRWATLDTAALPDALGAGLDGQFRVLLVSCYSQLEDPVGFAGNLVRRRMSGVQAPDLVLTVGDQVYLDSPPNFRAPYSAEELAKVFETTYRSTWTGTGYADILRAGPVAAIPDDHEYWNNFPHPGLLSSTTLLPGGAENWERAARAMYEGYQLGGPDRFSYRIEVPPLSFFLMDNRTFRKDGLTTRPEDLNAFREWTHDVSVQRLIPVVVTGPSLLQPPKGRFARQLDRNLANYDDYPEIMRSLMTLADEGSHVLALTGDVHYGRVTDGAFAARRPNGVGIGRVSEVISSPSSLVWSPSLGGWPRRHKPAPSVRPGFRPRGVDRRITWSTLHPSDPEDPSEQGNHVALLTFTGTAFGADLDVVYWMVSRTGDLADVSHAVPTIHLHRRGT